MEFEIKEVEIKDLVAAPWNPRKEITPESVMDLANDIKENGVLQNIGVWPEPKTKQLYIIFGNRRVVACRYLGLKTILAKVYSGTELEAREQTRSENELRIGVDPLEDSKLLCSIRDKGRTEQEIAAKYGLPIAFVCRRLKLADLAPSIRENVQAEENRKRRGKILDVFKKWANKNLVDQIKDYVGDDMSKLIDIIIVLKVSKWSCYGYDPKHDFEKWSKKRSVDNFVKVIADNAIRHICKYSEALDVRTAIWFFKKVDWKKVFSPDDYQFIKSGSFKNAY